MPKLLRIAQREYLYNLRRPAYLFSAFGTPLIILGLWGLIFAFFPDGSSETDFSRLGVVDNNPQITIDAATMITLPADEDGEAESYTLIPFESAEAAQNALDAFDADPESPDGIAAYFIISQNYRSDGRIEVISYEELPFGGPRAAFDQFLLGQLTEDISVELPVDRLTDPVDELTVLALDSDRETTEASLPVIVLIPLFFAITFWIALQTTGSFMVNGLVQERSNRIVEIIVTTVSPLQIMLGKIIGLGLLGLTQITMWGGLVLVFLLVAPQFEFFSILDGVSLPIDLFVIGFVFFIFGYFFFASLLAAVGVLASTEQQGNQYTVFVTMPGYFLVIFSIAPFIEDPGGTFPLVLSMLPITSPMAMIIRVGFSSVPLWQIGLSLGILLVSTVIVAWAGAKIFRWGLLMYGKKITPRDLISVIFGNVDSGTTISQEQEKEAETNQGVPA